jgi:catechol 2,3-dioxygenase-like lactoylglutathione lyase family enzyme
MNKPAPTSGMRHVALYTEKFEACETFYVNLLGMAVEWRPDANNVYLTSGNDNLALHKACEKVSGPQKLDHIGFILDTPELVDDWYQWLLEHDVPMRTKPKTHRDGARSFYCEDPDGIVVQMIYHPPIVSAKS